MSNTAFVALLALCIALGNALGTLAGKRETAKLNNRERTCHKVIPDEMEGYVFCSECGAEIGEYGYPNYCPNCGAKVVE